MNLAAAHQGGRAAPQGRPVGGTASRAHRHWLQGRALAARQRWPQAVQAFTRAASACPDDALFWLNLAHAQSKCNAFAEAESAARRCLALEPAQTLAHKLLGESLAQQHRYAESAEVLGALEQGGHSDPQAMVRHAATLLSLLRPVEATDVLLRALALQPDLIKGHALLSDALRDRGLKREAAECLRTVLALRPDDLEARARLSFEQRHVMDWRGLEDDVRQLEAALQALPDDQARSAASFGMLSLPLAPELQLRAARAESLMLAAGAEPLPRRSVSAGRLRLGLLSYDFREHPVSQLLVEALETLDRSRFELLLYSTGPDDGSALGARVRRAADRFTDLRGVGDPDAARIIRGDEVDLLVDLMGHTRGQRMGVLARRPAPVQLGFLGFPGSTGAACIDYIVGDPFVTPLALAPLYSERLAQMPLTFQPNDRSRPLPQPMTRARAGLPDEGFVLCAFNHTYKILPEVFDRWCAVLRRVPGAVLWLKQTNGQLQDNARREAAARGVDPARLVFAPHVSYADHFSRLALADAFADTWPYNAHTTASDALWAGVPVVTRYGNSYASRVAASVLNAAGLAELAFDNGDDYENALVALGTEPALRHAYREHLGGRREALPLFDTPRWVREFEQLLLRMAARARSGLAPDHLLAEPPPVA